jgi:hypothetical protein
MEQFEGPELNPVTPEPEINRNEGVNIETVKGAFENMDDEDEIEEERQEKIRRGPLH